MKGMHHDSLPDLPKTGHATIDTQHQEVFELVSLLDKALYVDTHYNIRLIIEFLEKYVEEHFLEEETYMLTKVYQGYSQHKIDHDVFKSRVFSLRHDFDEGMSDSRLFFAIRLFIDKLMYHIRTEDAGIAQLVEEDARV